MSDVTRILNAIDQGDPHAAAQLLPLVYNEFRHLAAHRLPGPALQAGRTALHGFEPLFTLEAGHVSQFQVSEEINVSPQQEYRLTPVLSGQA